MLIYNILGKTLVYSTDDETSTVAFQYDVSKRTLTTTYPLCVFEKQVYSILLILTVLIILAALTSGVINHRREQIEQQSTVFTADAEEKVAMLPKFQQNVHKLQLVNRLTSRA